MPQLIIALLVVGLGYYAWRTYKRETQRVKRELARKRAERDDTQAGQTLEKDPQTGVYHPRSEEE